jgi:thiol-disulfide isomerase/thioredoxin
MNKYSIGIGLVVIVLVAGYFVIRPNDTVTVLYQQDNTVAQETGDMLYNNESEIPVAQNDDAIQSNGDSVMEITLASGVYENYSPEKLAYAETGDVVLFFHASWCPSCRAVNKDIENNTDAIPSGVSILKLDYDKETELKQKYGVTTQHTFVQVDSQGTMIKKWSGGSTLDSIIAQL